MQTRFSLLILLSFASVSYLLLAAKPQHEKIYSVEYMKSKVIINKTTVDSVKKYFGKPMKKKFNSHVDYNIDQSDGGLPAVLSINFTDSIVNGSSTVKSYIITQPGKGAVASEGMK